MITNPSPTEDRPIFTTGQYGILKDLYEKRGRKPRIYIGQESYLDAYNRCVVSEHARFLNFVIDDSVMVSLRPSENITVESISRSCWLPAPRGFVQMNVDGSVKKGTDIVGIGVVFTECEGRILAIHSLGRRRHKCSLLAEFEGLQIGLSLAIRYGFRRVKIVTDNLQIAQALQGVRALHDFVEQIRDLHLSAFEDYSVVFQPRAANCAADILACLGGNLVSMAPEKRSGKRAKGFLLAELACIEDVERVPRFNIQFVPNQETRRSHSPNSSFVSQGSTLSNVQANKQRKTLEQGKYIPRQSQETHWSRSQKSTFVSQCSTLSDVQANKQTLEQGFPKYIPRQSEETCRSHSPKSSFFSQGSTLSDVQANKQRKTLGQGFPKYIPRQSEETHRSDSPKSSFVSQGSTLSDVKANKQRKTLEQGFPKYIPRQSEETHWSRTPNSTFVSQCSTLLDDQARTKTLEQGFPKYISREKLANIAMLIKRGIRRA